MSIVVGFNLPTAVMLVSDSVAIKGDTRQARFPKVVRRTVGLREYALGFVGDWDDIYTYLTLADQDPGADYTSTEWQIKHRRRCFDILQPANWREGDKYEPDIGFLIAASSGLYLGVNRGFISSIPEYDVIGSGSDILRYLYHHDPPPPDLQGVADWAIRVITSIGQVFYTVGPPCLVEVVFKQDDHGEVP